MAVVNVSSRGIVEDLKDLAKSDPEFGRLLEPIKDNNDALVALTTQMGYGPPDSKHGKDVYARGDKLEVETKDGKIYFKHTRRNGRIVAERYLNAGGSDDNTINVAAIRSQSSEKVKPGKSKGTVEPPQAQPKATARSLNTGVTRADLIQPEEKQLQNGKKTFTIPMPKNKMGVSWALMSMAEKSDNQQIKDFFSKEKFPDAAAYGRFAIETLGYQPNGSFNGRPVAPGDQFKITVKQDGNLDFEHIRARNRINFVPIPNPQSSIAPSPTPSPPAPATLDSTSGQKSERSPASTPTTTASSNEDINALDDRGSTKLGQLIRDHTGTEQQLSEKITKFINENKGKGIDFNKHGPGKSPPLLFAAYNGYAKVGELLIENGAEIDPRDPQNPATALSIATTYGHQDFVKMLSQSGQLTSGIVNKKTNSSEETALHLAAYGNNDEIVKILIVAGADRTAKNRDNKTAAEIAQERLENYPKDGKIQAVAQALKATTTSRPVATDTESKVFPGHLQNEVNGLANAILDGSPAGRKNS